MRLRLIGALSLSLIFLVAGCSSGAPASPEDIPVYTFQVVNSWPHDCKAFTQGLIFYQDVFYESTGQYGESSLRRVEPLTGKVLSKIKVSKEYFAEGIAIFQGKIFQLTWQSHKGFIYDLENFKRIGEFSYDGEGWGLTHDERSLIMSDGTNQLRFLDPVSLKVERTLNVFEDNHPLTQLNELEYVKGEIYANIWHTDRIVRIDPASGKILGSIDLQGLLTSKGDCSQTDVLNGIAYDEATDRLFVTGKLWPKVFEIKLKKGTKG
jgi:glutamine cyclotransferase